MLSDANLRIAEDVVELLVYLKLKRIMFRAGGGIARVMLLGQITCQTNGITSFNWLLENTIQACMLS